MKPNFAIKVKRGYILSLLVTFFFAFLVGGCADTFDYVNYKKVYEGIYYATNIEIGYAYLMSFCSSIGINYSLFRLLNVVVCYLVIFKVFYRYIGKQIIVLWVLYFLSAMAFDAVNLRNTIVTTFLICSFFYAIKNGTKGIVVYIGIILLCTLVIHRSSLLYLIFVAAFKKVNKEEQISFQNREILFFLTILLSLFLVSTPSVISSAGKMLFYLLSRFVNIPYQKTSYFIVKGHWGFLLYTICHLSFLLSIAFIKTQMYYYLDLNQDDIGSQDSFCFKFIEALNICNILLVLFLPMVRVNSEFYRIIRSVQLLEYVGFFIGLDYIPRYSKKRLLACLMIIICAVTNFIILILPYFDRIFVTMFTSNTYF